MNLKDKPIPKTIDEAIETLFTSIDEEDIAYIKDPKNTSGSIHFSLGMALRNYWHLWAEESPIKDDFKKRFNLFGHADDMSGMILEALWVKVRGGDVQKSIEESADHFNAHWMKCNVDPFTGEERANENEITGSD